MFGSVRHILRANVFLRLPAKRAASAVPELTEVRFPSIKRGNYNKLSPEHVKFFKSLLGEDRVVTDVVDVQSYNIDFAKHVRGRSEIVLQPKTTEEVSALVKFCNENNLAVCPQGGNTGLVAGSVPVFDEVIVSMALMNKIINLDEFSEEKTLVGNPKPFSVAVFLQWKHYNVRDKQNFAGATCFYDSTDIIVHSGALTCQAGCVLEVLDNYLAERDLMMPLDLGAKGTCQIGGNLSTNAGGIRLFRYGNLHGSVLGLEVVLASGEVLDLLSTVKKDNTGYHLKNLFVGAEGTLGVITKAVIQCPPRPKSINVAFLGLNTFEDVLETFKEARTDLAEIFSACELIDHFGFDRTIDVFKLQNPLSTGYKFYILVETRSGAGGNDLEKLTSFVEKMITREVVKDGVIANQQAQVKKIWEIRENVALAVFKGSYAYKYDISLPLKNFYNLVEIMRDKLKHTSATLITGYGHLGDGNLHLNICSKEYDQHLKDQIEPFVFEVAHKFKGSISAEHGIGLEKPGYLHFSKSQASIRLMKEVKRLLDPKAILNPYKVLPP